MSMDPKDRDNSKGQGNEGEGNKTAARHYNKATTEFAESGQVGEKAREAERAIDGAEGDKLRKAERDGLRKARH